MWACDVLECKSCGKSLTSGAWSSCTNANFKPQTWQQGTIHMTCDFDVCGSWEMPKYPNLKVSNNS